MGSDCSRSSRGSGSAAAVSRAPIIFTRIGGWNDGAERGLAHALDAHAQNIRDGVNDKRMELWQLEDGDGCFSWLVTEVRNKDTLIVWCYQGRGAKRVMELLMVAAKNNKLQTVEFWTPHRALGRLLRPFGFELVVVDDDGVMKFQADT